ncbi:MAG: hypothetical protein ACJ759_22395 [Thermoanaerobaculia bacterium]
MRNVRFQPFLLAFLLGLSAFGMGCRQSEEPENGRVAIEQDAQDAQDREIATRDPELQPEERTVVVEPETGEDAGARQDLEARERQLAERQAELDARERRLREPARQPERQARAPQPPPRVKPAPRVEREEPVQPERTEEIAEPQRPDTRDEDAREAAEVEPEREAREEEERRPAPLVVNVPAGTVLEVEFLESVSSQTAEPGDIFRVRVASDVSSDGAVGIPAGSEIVGVVTEAVPLRKVGGQAKLGLKFTDLVLPSGKTVPIQASFASQGRSETRKDAATIGGAAAGGAILGRVLSRKDRSRGAVIGAIIGAAAGAAIASKTPGEEVTIERGTKVDLKLDDEVEVRARGK